MCERGWFVFFLCTKNGVLNLSKSKCNLIFFGYIVIDNLLLAYTTFTIRYNTVMPNVHM